MRHRCKGVWAAAVWALLASGCPSDLDADLVARIGWQLDYRDHSKPLCACAELAQSDCEAAAECAWSGSVCANVAACTTPDLRGCDNQPEDLEGAPAYPAMAQVHLSVVDPVEGTVARDADVDCAEGDREATFRLLGITRTEQRFALTAADADGSVWYASEAPETIDLRELYEGVFTLRAVTGELAFDFVYPGEDPGVCPSDVATLSYTLTDVDDASVSLSGTWDPACEPPDQLNNTYTRKLFVRGIDAVLTAGGATRRYAIEVEAQDAGGAALFCGSDERGVPPGRTPAGADLVMLAGACP